MVFTKDLLKLSDFPDIVLIPIFSEDYFNESKNLVQEINQNIMFPEVLSHLQHEFKFCNDKLSYLHPKSMFRLEKLGVLPELLLDLKDDVPLCLSCVFLTSRTLQCIKKIRNQGPYAKTLTINQ